jgi:DNA transformation protein
VKGTHREDFVEHVCDLLAPLGDVRPKSMFGGYGIYVDEVFCAIIASDTLYFKVDDGNRADYQALDCDPFKPFEGKTTVMSYYEVPADVMDDRARMVEWGRKAREAARRSGTNKRAISRPKAKKARSTAPSAGKRK